MTTPSTPPSQNLPLDNMAQPVIVIPSGPPPAPLPPRTPPMPMNNMNTTQQPVPSGPPTPQSLATTRSQTLRRLLHGYGSLDVATIIEPLAPHFTHEVLPQSLKMPVRGKADFAHHASMVFSAFKRFEMKPTELWEDSEKGEVILRCAMEGVLKPMKKTDGGKEETQKNVQAKENAQGDVETKTDVISHVEVEDEEYNSDDSESSSDEDLDLEPVDGNGMLADPALPSPPSSPYMPGTVLSPITEVTESPSEAGYSPPPAFTLTHSSSQEEQDETSSPPTPAEESRHASPPTAAAQELPHQEKSQQDSPHSPPQAPKQPQEKQEENTDDLHWTNECLLIISFTPCGHFVSRIQEFVDSHKAVEMKKKHAPKGFDEASAPPPPTYKPATYINLETLKLKEVAAGGGYLAPSVTVMEVPPSPSALPSVPSLVYSEVSSLGTSPSPQHAKLDRGGLDGLTRLDRGVQCGIGIEHLNSLDTLDSDTFTTTTEYPSSHQGSFCLDAVTWHSSHGAENSASESEADGEALHRADGSIFQGIRQNASSVNQRRCKKLRFASHVEDTPTGYLASASSMSSNSSTSGNYPNPSTDSVAGSGSDSASASARGCYAGSGHFFEPQNVHDAHDAHADRQGKASGWGSTLADTFDVLREFVPAPLIPVDFDRYTGEVAVKKEWISGATFVAGFALGKLVFGGLGDLGGGVRGGRGGRGGMVR